jgi:hypothetical protein
MAVMLRSEIGASALPAVAPTAAEIAKGKQAGSTQMLAVYSVMASVDVSTTERISFTFEGGARQTYAQASAQYMTDENGHEYFYGTVCVRMDPGRGKTGFADWLYAMSRTPDTQLADSFKV